MRSLWTNKHDALCLKFKLRPSAKLLWQWLVHEKIQEEPDLNDFNKWIEKHRGKPFHRDTIKQAWQQLADVKIIYLLKKFSWRIWRIAIKTAEDLLTPLPRKKSCSRSFDRDLHLSNPGTVQGGSLAAVAILNLSQEQIEVINLVDKAGIQFADPSVLIKHSPDEVKAAITHFYRRGGHEKIDNPQGWLISCLSFRWWEESNKWPSFIENLLAAIKKNHE